MKFCTECGKKINDKDKFCAFCGANVPDYSEENESENSKEEKEDVPKSSKEEKEEEKKEKEEENKSKSSETDKKKSLAIAMLSGVVAILLIFLAVGYMNPNDKYDSMSSENSTNKAKSTISFSEDEVSLVSVNDEEYPDMQVKFDINKDKKISKEDLDISMEENGKNIDDFEMELLGSETGTQLVLNYKSKYLNNTNSTQDVKLDFDFNPADISTDFSVMSRQELVPGYVSYNTDNYPKVTMYLSFMGINDDITNAILENPEYYSMYEDGNPININSIDKLSEEGDSLSIDIVMDASSSMRGSRLDTVKYVANKFVENMDMNAKDRVAFMSFSSKDAIYQYSFKNNTNEIRNQIRNLNVTGGSTSLYKAMQEAVMETAYNEQSGSKFIIVFTDGRDNDSGYVNARTVVNDALQYGVQIYLVGLTESRELRSIAESTGGEYFKASSNLDDLYDLYRSIYEKKKNQYAITYTSDIKHKQKRDISLEYDSPLFESDYKGKIIPKLVDDMEIINTMRNYQINWSRALNELDASYLYDYVNTDNYSKESCYKIAKDQVNRKLKETDRYSAFSVPIYNLVAADRVSSTHYRLTVNKKFVQKYYVNNSLKKTFYIGKTYEYNLILKDNKWVVDSVTTLDVPTTFYTDDSFTTVKN